MKPLLKLLPIAIVLSIVTSSCFKDLFKPRNQGTVNVSGTVINKQTGIPVSGVPVKLSWVTRSSIPNRKDLITSVTSGSNGSFNFSASVDTSRFATRYMLQLEVNDSNDYIALGDSANIETYSYTFNDNALKNIQFEVYRKANLTLRWNKTQNLQYQLFAISISKLTRFLYSAYYASENPVTGQMTIPTVADIFTGIKVEKKLADGTIITAIDSIKCSSNTNNIYDVNF